MPLFVRCCYVSVYFLLFCVGFQLVTQFNKNNLEIVCRFKIRLYICIVKQLKQSKMKATITTLGNMVFLNFFNTKEIYSVKGFDTVRKANNYAKKYGYTIYEKLPEGVREFEYCN